MARPSNSFLRVSLAGAALLAASVAASGAAHADSDRCQGFVRAESSVRRAFTGAYDGVSQGQIKHSYNAAFADGRRDAIRAWHEKVERVCPGHSASWFRARDKHVEECDRAMGGRFTVCASARPVRRLFGL